MIYWNFFFRKRENRKIENMNKKSMNKKFKFFFTNRNIVLDIIFNLFLLISSFEISQVSALSRLPTYLIAKHGI